MSNELISEDDIWKCVVRYKRELTYGCQSIEDGIRTMLLHLEDLLN